MIIENTGLNGVKSELSLLDEVSEQLGFVRWQWEYYRATYDCKFVDSADQSDYYLRVNTRAVEGKLESPDAVLEIEDVYIGKATYPRGLDYSVPMPDAIMKAANEKIAALKQKLG